VKVATPLVTFADRLPSSELPVGSLARATLALPL
jgi:hypothetical protein